MDGPAPRGWCRMPTHNMAAPASRGLVGCSSPSKRAINVDEDPTANAFNKGRRLRQAGGEARAPATHGRCWVPSPLQESRGSVGSQVKKVWQTPEGPSSGANGGSAHTVKINQKSGRASGIQEGAVAGGEATASQAWR